MQSNSTEPIEIENYRNVPYLDSAHQCGFQQPFFDDGMDFIMIPEDFLGGIKKPLIINATGDSMAPTIENGDQLIIDLAAKPQHNDKISCRLNGQFLIKILFINNFSTYLKCINSEYEDHKIMPDDDFEILGRIERVIKRI